MQIIANTNIWAAQLTNSKEISPINVVESNENSPNSRDFRTPGGANLELPPLMLCLLALHALAPLSWIHVCMRHVVIFGLVCQLRMLKHECNRYPRWKFR